jgi:hypothetical protein
MMRFTELLRAMLLRVLSRLGTYPTYGGFFFCLRYRFEGWLWPYV